MIGRVISKRQSSGALSSMGQTCEYLKPDVGTIKENSGRYSLCLDLFDC